MDVFVARQPIFNKNQEVVAYELLYRSGTSNSFRAGTDGDMATSDVMTNGLVLIGVDKLVDNKRAFVNFTEKLLLEGMPELFPKDNLVVEVLENIEPAEDIIRALRSLKNKGYIIALDDFVFDQKYEPFIELADIIKIDFILTVGAERKEIVDRTRGNNIRFLAEKVETVDDFEQAINYGYSYFQGYFFSKPTIVTGKDIPGMLKSHIQLLQKINSPEPDFEDIARLIEKDLSVSYKLLKYLNYSGQFLMKRILSIKHALVVLGIDEIRKWISLIITRGLGEQKPDEVLRTCLVRARMCELIAGMAGLRKRGAELFLLGMFSLIDVLTNRPLSDILNELPISEDIKAALEGKKGLFSSIYMLILSYEKGDWDSVQELAAELRIDPAGIPVKYLDALHWTEGVFEVE
ncbi:MAG: EAL and HDOD domain-containing protein [Bacillota bacterium]